MSFPTISAPVKSPSLAEFGDAQYTDPSSGKVLPLLGVALPDSNGNTGLAAGAVAVTDVSQVTAKANRPQAGTAKIPMVALVGLNPTTGAPAPFAAPSAVKVSGKFQSSVQTGTGSSQNIAHGLGVVPTLVLVAPYNTTDSGIVAAGYSIVEGAHDATNVKVTATSALQYKVIAFA